MEIEIIDYYGKKNQLSSGYCMGQNKVKEAVCSSGKKSGYLSCGEGNLSAGWGNAERPMTR